MKIEGWVILRSAGKHILYGAVYDEFDRFELLESEANRKRDVGNRNVIGGWKYRVVRATLTIEEE